MTSRKEVAVKCTIQLRRDQLDKYRRIAGLTTQERLAERMGMHQGTVAKVLSGYQTPSKEFIASLVAAFDGATFDDLWQIIPAEAA